MLATNIKPHGCGNGKNICQIQAAITANKIGAIRNRDDRGHFVVLSSAFPSRLLSAFPAETPVTRLTLDEALQRVRAGVSECATVSEAD